MHCLTRIRFALVLRKIHFTLDDKLHFCGKCIVMKPACNQRAKTTGKNWPQCEKCESWTHSACLGYSKEEFHFLERAQNLVFLCHLCLPDAQKPATREASPRGCERRG